MFVFFFNGERISALTLANYVLQTADHVGIEVDNIKLQKILYYVQGYYLARFDHPLFPEEIHSWKFGPAIPDVYYAFAHFYPYPLRMLEIPDMSDCPEREMQLIDHIITVKLQMTRQELIESSVNESPWREATDCGSNIRRFQVISHESLKNYFKTKE